MRGLAELLEAVGAAKAFPAVPEITIVQTQYTLIAF